MKKKFVCLVLSCIFIFSCLSMVHAEGGQREFENVKKYTLGRY